jgi:phage-related protein
MATVADLVIRVDSDVNKAIAGLFSLKGAMLALSPAALPATIAIGGIAAGAAAAGAAIGAFGLAAAPAVSEVTNAFKLQEAAVTAAAQGGAAATAAQKKYNDAVKGLSTPQKQLLTQFNGLNTEYKTWSKGLQGSTMPVFTKGIEAARAVLPQLTPLVKSAGTALSGFMDQIKVGVQSGGFKAFMADLAKFSGPALKNFLGATKNIIVGVGGMIQAFLPMSGQMTGGLEKATAAFAKWGTSLKSSSGFSSFVSNGKTLGTTLGQIAKALVGVLVSLEPMLQAASGIGLAFATIINNTPVPVLVAIGKALLIAKAAMMAYRTYVAITTAVTAIWTSSIWASTAALLANPMTWIVIAIIALIAVIVLIATKTTWFQTIWKTVWGAIKTATIATWNFIKMAIKKAIDFIVMIFLNFSVPGLIIKHWETIKNATKAAWDWVMNAIKTVWSWIKTGVVAYFTFYVKIITTVWNTVRTVTKTVWNAVRSFLVGVFNAIRNFITTRVNNIRTNVGNAFSAIKTLITNAINRAKAAVVTAVGKIASTIQSIKSRVKNALAGAATWLFNAGKAIIKGLISGIKSMAGSVKNAVGSVVKGARNLLPFSPAKEGPFSGTGYTTYSGRALMTDWAKGMQSRAALPVQAAASAAKAVAQGTQIRQTYQPIGGQSTQTASWRAMASALMAQRMRDREGLTLDVTGADEDMKKLIRKLVRTDRAFGAV